MLGVFVAVTSAGLAGFWELAAWHIALSCAGGFALFFVRFRQRFSELEPEDAPATLLALQAAGFAFLITCSYLAFYHIGTSRPA